MRRWKIPSLLAGSLLAGVLLVGGPSPQVAAPSPVAAQRPPRPLPPPQRPPDPLEEFELNRRRRQQVAERERRRREQAARAEHRQAFRRLREDLPRLRETLQAVEAKLAGLDPENELSVELRQRGEEMEELAKRINENLKRL